MLDEREIENRIERVPAAPDRLLVLSEYAITAGNQDAFEAQWRESALSQSQQAGYIFLRLHRDAENPARFVTYDLWKSRSALITAIRSLADETTNPLSRTTHQTFVRLIDHVRSQSRKGETAESGQVATVRHFYLKVHSEPEFERLWRTSARNEAVQPGCLYKRLHRDLNLPTHYVSYSLWANREAPDEAANQHAHYQAEHSPYPLASPVTRSTLEVRAHIGARS
jgi:heme-degrading monooxygenase HmoA